MPRSFVLPNQPVKHVRSRTFNIKRSRLHIEIDYPNRGIKGKVTHWIDPIKSIDFIELDSAELDIGSVKVNGKESKNYLTGTSKLSIPLGFALKPGETAEIEIIYSGHPKLGVFFRGPTKDFPQRKPHVFTHGEAEDSKYYFPCYDAPNMRTLTETSLTVPSNWIAISNGRLVEEPKESSGMKTWHFQQTIPHPAYLVSFAAGEFEKIEEEHEGVLLEYVFPPGRSEDAKRSFAKTPKMLDFFGKVTGQKYPYPKYSQTIVSDFMAGGMENITATTLTDRTLHDERSHIDFQSDNLVGHELAHQWFGDWITCKEWSHAWLNEGFATYFNALFREYDLGVDDFQYFMYKPSMEKYREELDRYQREIVSKRYWDPDEIFDMHTYEKGSMVLNALRGMLGDDLFFAGIRNYVAKHKNSTVETSDFREAMEEASGQELERFFEQWIYSPGLPDYSISCQWNTENSLAVIKVEQNNAGADGVPVFTTAFELRFWFGDGSKISKTMSMSAKSQTFVFAFDKAPVNINFDPRNWIPKTIRFLKPKEMSLYQLKNDENVMERVRACTELSHFQSADVIRSLGESIQKDKSWGVRVESGIALGKIGSSEALEILLSNSGNKDHKIRRGVAIGLRGFSALDEPLRDRAINALATLLVNDESYFVRAYAAWSLGFFKNDERAFEAMSKARNQESVNDVVRERLYQGFEERKDPRAVPYAIEELESGLWHQGRGSAAHCLGRIGRDSPKALEALLKARNFANHYVRKEAALAVGDYGDPSALPELRSWLEKESTGSVARCVRESIYLLETKLKEREQAARVSAELEKLSEQTKMLEVKLNELANKGSNS